MSWHRTPTDDAWKQAHLAMVEGLGKRLWLGCDGCQHAVMIAPCTLAERHGLDMRTPLLPLSRALRCRQRRGVQCAMACREQALNRAPCVSANRTTW